MVSSSQTISFSKDEKSSIILELDDKYHVSLYGEELSEFSRTQMVYLKMFPTYAEKPYEILTSEGECTIDSRDNVEEVIDLLVFADEKSAELSGFPVNEVVTEWVAGPDVPVLITERQITTPEKVVGILKCTYYKAFDRLKLRVDEDMESSSVIVLVKNDGDSAYEEVPYTGTEVRLRNITLVIKDIVSDDPIPNADVVVSLSKITVFSGITNANGKVTIFDLIEGATYDLSVKATDYIDSDEDYLNNDSFTVPSSEG